MNNIEAKKETYQDYVNQIYRFCMFKLNNKEDAEDMTSEVFTKFFTQDINKITNARAWLYATARNAIYDKRVRNSTENLTVANVAKVEDEENIEFNEYVDSYNFENEVEKQELIKIIEDQMKTLSSVEQDIIIMRVWDEMKFGEISQAIKESEDSIKKKYYRAVDKIKINLQSSAPKFRASSFVSPAIFTSLLTIGKSTSLAAEAKFTSTILTNLLSSSFMITETVAAATTAASSASGVATAGGISILGLTGTKLVLATTGAVTLVAGGVGTAVVVSNNTTKNQEIVQAENEIISEPEIHEKEEDRSIEETAQSQDCKNVRYVNSFYKNVSFEYNDCDWRVVENNKNFDLGMPVYGNLRLEKADIYLENKVSSDWKIYVNINNAPSGWGYQCSDKNFKIFGSGRNINQYVGRVQDDSGNYIYVEDIITSDHPEWEFYKSNTAMNPYGQNMKFCYGGAGRLFSSGLLSPIGDWGRDFRMEIDFQANFIDTVLLEKADKIFQSIKATNIESIKNFESENYSFSLPMGMVEGGSIGAFGLNVQSKDNFIFFQELNQPPSDQKSLSINFSIDMNTNNLSLDEYIEQTRVKWQNDCNQIGIQQDCNLNLTKTEYKGGYKVEGFRGLVARVSPVQYFFKSPTSNKIIIVTPDLVLPAIEKMIESVVVK